MKSFQIPCVCGGRNPGCYRCDGWGYVGETAIPVSGGMPGSPRSSKKRSEPVRKDNRTEFEKTGLCPFCGEVMPDAQDHIIKGHGVDNWVKWLLSSRTKIR